MENGLMNIALVGCGGMAARYRSKYTQIPGACLKLLVDANPEVAREASAELGVESWSTRFEDALKPEIHIVDISTPNFLHASQAIAALEAGKSVLLQKPIAPTIEEGEKIVDTARRTGRQLGIYMSMHENPIYYDIKRILDNGLIGKVANVYCRGAHRGGLKMASTSWRNSLEKTGGGAFIQLTIHQFNMVQWLINSRITRVAAFSKNRLCPNVGGDDITNAACEFENGILGTLEASYCSSPNIVAIYGTKGFVSIINDRKVDIQLEECFEGETFQYAKPGEIETHCYDKIKAENPYDQHIAFVKAMMQGKSAPIPAEIGLYDLKIVKAVYQSAQEMRFIDIK